jgi:anti-sigma regulatory factor (Ser/Thr protein kinase)
MADPEDHSVTGDPAVLELSGRRSDAGLARRFLSDLLPGIGWGDRLDDACLLLGELIANVALHVRSVCIVRVRATPGILRIEVVDGSPAMPRLLHFSADATTGRGMKLVDRIADSWGAEPLAAGKVVWFCLARDAAMLGQGRSSWN